MLKHRMSLLVFLFCFLCSSYTQAETLQDAIKKNGKYERVVQLVTAGADVNEKDEVGSTPLFWAAGIGKIDITEYLIIACTVILDTKNNS